MRSLVVIATLLHVALGGSQVAVRLPFLNPAGVTYVGGPAPYGLAAGPAAAYAAPALAAAPALSYAAHPPALSYAAHAPALSYAAHPGPLAAPYAAVPTIHHVPGEAHVPVTRLEAQHGVISKEVDVAHPAVATRRFEIRRPAIQKQFYDIEERVIVRPAGSALVELDQPLSKAQRGPAVVSSALGHAPVLGSAPALAPVAITPSPFPVTSAPVAVTPSPFPVTPSPFPVGLPPQPAPGPSGPAFDDDSFVVENPELSRAAAPLPSPAPRSEAEARALPPPPPPPPAQVEVQARGAPGPFVAAAPDFGPAPVPVAAPAAVVPSLRNLPLDPNVDQANQQRLIALLTERGGVAEVGFGRAGPAALPVGDAGPVRARVLSATAAPPLAPPAGERVNTRRVVVSRPIETVQEVDVVEPATKLQRVSVHQPTLFKTLRQELARVPTSVPVLGKTLAPIAHAPYAAAPFAAAPAALPYGLYH